MRKRVLIGCILALSACGGDSTSPDPAQAAVGTYALTQVNGKSVPMTYAQDPLFTVEILNGTMTLRSDLSYTQVINSRTTYTDGTPTRTQTYTENGTFAVSGGTITFTIPANGANPAVSYAGGVANGVVAYTLNGDTSRFQR